MENGLVYPLNVCANIVRPNTVKIEYFHNLILAHCFEKLSDILKAFVCGIHLLNGIYLSIRSCAGNCDVNWMILGDFFF